MDRLTLVRDVLHAAEATLRQYPGDSAAAIRLAGCLSRQPSLAVELDDPDVLRQALTSGHVDPQSLAIAAAIRVLAEPDEALLITLLQEAIIAHPTLEARLTQRRRDLCLTTPSEMRAIAAALAVQGRLNEFVWHVTEEETQRLPSAPAWVQAMYSGSSSAMPDSPVKALTAIAAGNSARVRQQYEQNPYPRWRRLTLIEPSPKPDADVLVVGCGTGQDLLTAAWTWRPKSVTGVDLSAASLAYARRMAQQYGLPAEFLQADLLLLDDWDRRFDVIICTGVLHHLENPAAGWRQLARLLRPGGLLLVGLYSEVARRGITVAQQQVRELGLSATPAGIRVARQLLGHGTDCGLLLDYYYMSGCRDLLFHAQEHQFTLLEIGQTLDDVGLRFVDMQTTNDVRSLYQTLFGFGASLTCWDAMEQLYPRTFLGMYRFWCQKPESSVRAPGAG